MNMQFQLYVCIGLVYAPYRCLNLLLKAFRGMERGVSGNNEKILQRAYWLCTDYTY